MKYMVMECHTGYAVLLDEEGRFWKAADLHYEVGQTVENPVLMKQPQPSGSRRITRLMSSAIAAAAACLFLFFGFGYYQNYLRVYSSIYLSINPEVLMDLNRYGNVVRLTGTNEDGVRLLEGYSGRGKDKLTVADELIDRAIEMGFLSEGGQVSFFIDSPEEALFQEYGTELRTEISGHLDGRITITVEIMNYQDAPADDMEDDYDDTDYGPENDSVTDYQTPEAAPAPAPQAPAPVPSAPVPSVPAAPAAESIPPDHTDGDTDYEPENAAAPFSDDDAGEGRDSDDDDDDDDDADDDDDNGNDDDNDSDDDDGDD